MRFAKLARLGCTLLLLIIGAPIALNAETISQRLGWDHAVADIVAPKSGPSPVAEFVSQPWVLAVFLFLLGIAAGLWIDSILRMIDSRREARRWWEGMKSFSIERASCLLVGISPCSFANSNRAKAVADELIGLVRAGLIPLNMEQSMYSDEILDNVDFEPDMPLYKPKPNVGKDAVLAKRQIEQFGKSRDYKIPWLNG